ncbi:hypothetical protein TNCT_396071 [Trichonephila clavata]|uniref:Uncharacterized protein n=1 Tax=Trichonephila clavata TaxID=2740835 RepID=A0A8X6LUH5_TRICU|nr:hypothetical protein TNCT_396071 [Trichonephila clavata]
MDVNVMPGDVPDEPYFQGLIPLKVYRADFLGLLHIKWDAPSNSPHDRGCRKTVVVVGIRGRYCRDRNLNYAAKDPFCKEAGAR